MATRIILMAAPTKIPELAKSDVSLQDRSSADTKPLDLNDIKPQKVTTRAKSLEEWAQSIMSPKQDEMGSYQNAINLSRFGLKNAQDVIEFLKSPGGEATLAEIGATLNHRKAIQEQQIIDRQAHDRLMHQLRALLFLWFIEGKTHAAHRLRDLIEKQNNKLLKDEAKLINSSTSRSEAEKRAEIGAVIASYDKVIHTIDKKLELNATEEKELEALMDKLEHQGKQIEAKYNEYESELLQLENSPAHENLSEPEIDSQIKLISSEMDKLTDIISQLLDTNDEDGARALLHKQNALNLKAATFYDMKAVHNSKKYYADAQGNAVGSFKDAHFILSKGETQELDQKLIKVDNKMFLLKPGQNWDSIKDNTEAKNKARNDYKHSKQEFMSVKKVVQHHKMFELTIQKAQVNDTEKQITQNKNEQILLKNQMNLVQSARASAENLLKQNNLAQEAPRPTPTAGHAATPKPSQASATLFYREQIKLLKQSQNISYDDLLNLANRAPGKNSSRATEFLKQEFTKLSRNSAIPQTTMQNLLINLEKFGVTPKKQLTEAPHNSPSPLSTKPDPFKR